MAEINGADTAWLLAATSMVLIMTFGLAVFYGGMVRSKNVMNTMMMVVATVAIATVVWFGWAYSIAFTADEGGGLFGGFSDAWMTDTATEAYGTVPKPLFATFQLTFALITCGLVAGSIVDRAKFSAWCVFIVIWITVVYAPMAHWALLRHRRRRRATCRTRAGSSSTGRWTSPVAPRWRSVPARPGWRWR